jgi:hypothetical protein
MAIYRTLYYTDVSVGVIDEGDSLTVRVEENPRGGRQMVIWRAEQQAEED